MQVGDKFAGCTVRFSYDTPSGHAWVFERNNHAVRVELSQLDYATFCLDRHERERILDQMAARIAHELFKDRITVFQ